jgi:tRNA (guanosine-2'-O-)-methyltransferase
MTPEREARIRAVAARRQFDLGILLENVTDPHNIMAVTRTADAVGLAAVHALNTYNPWGRHAETKAKRKAFAKSDFGARSSSGAGRWVDVRRFSDREEALGALRESLGPDARLIAMTAEAAEGVPVRELHEVDFTGPCAVVMGNERAGLSPELLAACDARCRIPQAGMTRSLNISVAAAVVLYEALRQRRAAGRYDRPRGAEAERGALAEAWLERERARRR